MLNDINNYADRLRPAGILYVDVYPYLIGADGTVEFLLLRRRDDVPLPGQWQAVSGKIKAGERIADAFVRQVRDKTRQSPRRVMKLAAVSTFYDEYYDTVMLVPGAAAELERPDVELDGELHVEYRWAGLEQAKLLLPWLSQREAIEAIDEAVRLGGASAHCQPLQPSAFSSSADLPDAPGESGDAHREAP